jgi:DNA-binding NarL/FixJ family response regulator
MVATRCIGNPIVIEGQHCHCSLVLASRKITVAAQPRLVEVDSIRGFRTGRVGVLVVDDHQAVRAELERLLGADAELAPVISASNASVAIGRACQFRPLLAVVDFRLPGRDGISLTLELKQLPEPPGVVIYSAFAAPRLALAAIVAGADAIVEKGTSGRQLTAVVSAVLAGAHPLAPLSATALGAAIGCLAVEDRPLVTMLNGGSAADQVAKTLGITLEWLQLRRWAIVRLLVGAERLAPPSPDSRP